MKKYSRKIKIYDLVELLRIFVVNITLEKLA
jgi:hypothetical protein